MVHILSCSSCSHTNPTDSTLAGPSFLCSDGPEPLQPGSAARKPSIHHRMRGIPALSSQPAPESGWVWSAVGFQASADLSRALRGLLTQPPGPEGPALKSGPMETW
ncbi:unnamed protein product [Boreogadus saida]